MSTKVTFKGGPVDGFELHLPDDLTPLTDYAQVRVRLPVGGEQFCCYELFSEMEGYTATPVKAITFTVDYGEA